MKIKRFLKICAITVTATLIILIPFLWGFLPNYYLLTDANGESMQPTLPLNGIRLYEITSDVQMNDIILFSDGNDLVGHRLIYIENNIYWCKGDNNGHIDWGITREDIIGKLVFSTTQRSFNDLFGGIIEISIIGLLFIFWKIRRGDKNEEFIHKKT